jgi:Peptidase family M48
MWVLAVASLASSQPLPAYHAAIAVRVAGDGLPQCRSFQPDGSEGPCLPSFTITSDAAINGWSRDGLVSFSTGALSQLTRDEFAMLAGHEIAHWYLGHGESGPDTELAADRLGAELACRAGFDPIAGTGLFHYLGQDLFHPEAAVRRKVVASIGCKPDIGGP